MLDVIDDLLEAEQQAQEMLDAAKRETTARRSSYSDEETRLLREAEQAADKELREAISEAREEHDRRISSVEAELREAENQFEEANARRLDEAVLQVVRLIVSGDGSE